MVESWKRRWTSLIISVLSTMKNASDVGNEQYLIAMGYVSNVRKISSVWLIRMTEIKDIYSNPLQER